MSSLRDIETASLDDLATRFDVFLLDQYGVLHDGLAPYPGAVEALEKLKQAGKRIALISNSGKRASVNEQRLYRLGFTRRSFDLILTSGEVAWNRLNGLVGMTIPRHAKCLMLTSDEDKSAIDGLDLEVVEDGTQAEIVLISGSRGEAVGMAEYGSLLKPAVRRGVPAICTNPDKIMLSGTDTQFGAGAIADLYASLGGQVTWIGKPHPEIYEAALTAIGDPDRSRVLCLGDSVEHDIVGGANAGCRVALLRSGILNHLDRRQLEAVFGQHNIWPDFLVPRFIWGRQ